MFFFIIAVLLGSCTRNLSVFFFFLRLNTCVYKLYLYNLICTDRNVILSLMICDREIGIVPFETLFRISNESRSVIKDTKKLVRF